MCLKYSRALLTEQRRWVAAQRKHGSAGSLWRRHFRQIVTWCVQILEARQDQGVLQRYRPLVQLARPYFFRHVVLPAAKSICRGRRIMEHDLAYISNLEKAAAVVDSRLKRRNKGFD